ncbi:MAG TPA: YbdD/YjiX family protein [Actinomycetales bacterium]|jgi:uncharacterized short protein YbdD (DUF466 family)|nr:YbdD/YjiX family protein [Actinomycetales bacterium]
MRRWSGAVMWYLRELFGENAYDKYVAHLARDHPGRQPMSRRQFEWERTDRLDRNPGARCC